MELRLFPDGQAYVANQDIDVTHVDGTIFLPLEIDSVDIDTLVTNVDLVTSNTPTSIVLKENNTFIGTLKGYTDHYATVSTSGIDRIIRNYDQIENPHLITAISDSRIGNQITASYMTKAINGHVVHHLHTDRKTLESTLLIENKSLTDIVDARIEVITGEQARPEVAMFRAEAMSMADSTPVSSDIGTIYKLDGLYDIPAGYQGTVTIIDEAIDMNVVYVIDAPNGRKNATYTLQMVSPQDIPPGRLLVYQDDMLQARTSISTTGEGQEIDVHLVKVPSVYAQGDIQVTNNNDGNVRTSSNVTLIGTLYNILDTNAIIHLRYYVGDATVSNGNKNGSYVIFPYNIPARTTRNYSHSFVVSY